MKIKNHKNLLSGRAYLRLLPVIIWLAIVGIVVGLFSHRARRFEVIGIAQGQIYQVASTTPGRLTSISVGLFDEVKKDQTVAVINTVLENEMPPEQIKAQLATIEAEAEHLISQLATTKDTLLAEKSDRQNNCIADMRRFAVDIENLRLEILRLRALTASDEIMLEDLAMEVKISKYLLEQQAVTPYDLQKAKTQYNTMAKKIQENKQLLELANTVLQEAIQRQNQYAKQELYQPSLNDALDVIRKAIQVQVRRRNELLVALEALESRKAIELKAPFDGVVTRIQDRTGEFVFHKPGEAVLAGDPILSITESRPTEIIGYANEAEIHQVKKGMEVELIKPSAPEQIAYSKVTYVGPNMEQMPMQLWQNPNVPQWGRPFRIEVPSQFTLLIGERIGIRRL